MKIVERKDLSVINANGRIMQRVCGDENAAVIDHNMLGIFARFAPQYGSMETHFHETEYMYVIEAKDAYASYGNKLGEIDNRCTLKAGDIIRPHDGEWHRFDFTSDEGYVDFLNFFSVGTNHVVIEEK